MTDPEYKGMAIIIAGYPKDMELMLSKNVGLKSRFQRFFDFPDWAGSDCKKFVAGLAKKGGYKLDQEVEALLDPGFTQLIQYPGLTSIIQLAFQTFSYLTVHRMKGATWRNTWRGKQK
jgi:hypothetical protein